MDNLLNCDRFEEHVQDVMDRREMLTEDLQLRRHASQCDECSQLLEKFLTLELALNGAFPAGDHGPAIKVAGREQYSPVYWMAAVSALAAALLLFFLIPLDLGGERSVVTNDAPVVAALEVESPSDGFLGSRFTLPQLSVPRILPVRFEMAHTIPVSLRSAYGYAAELPGVRPLECSVSVTIEMLQRSLGHFSGQKQIPDDPDLGYFDGNLSRLTVA